MSNWTVGPRAGMVAILIVVPLLMFGGMYIGWSLGAAWGTKTELAVHIGDSNFMMKLRKVFQDDTDKVINKYEKINVKKLGDCGNVKWSDLMRDAE